MYQVTVKGRTLEELKKAVNDINNELTSGIVSGCAVKKDLDAEILVNEPTPVAPAIQQVGRATREVPVQETPEPYLVEVAKETLASTTPVQPINPDSELDAEGLPWDKRIHSKGKTKMKKEGTWKRKKNIEESLYESVKAELRNSVALAANPPVVPALPVASPVLGVDLAVPGADKTVEQTVTPTLDISPVQPAPVLTEVPKPAPMNTGGHTLATFIANFPMVLGDLISKGKVNQDYINSLKTYFNVAEIWSVTDVQKEEMFNSFIEYGFIQKV